MKTRLRPVPCHRFLATVAVTGLLLVGCEATTDSPASTARPTGPVRTSAGTASPTPGSTAGPTGPAVAPSTPPAAEPALGPGLQPLWPFTTLEQARAWQRSHREGGHQPWHLDADQTALAFVQGYLGFREMDRISSHSVSGRHARIGVGLGNPQEARRGTAAVLHLVRYGTEPDAPWEVVGTDDTTFSLTAPAYGSPARTPLAVGGRITGVDESISVQVREPSSPLPLGTACCTSAGGEHTPWTSTVSYTHPTDPVLTVVAATGGHLAEVERFTVTAVRTR
ncbi:hypothetical protein [Streptomyces sp. NPDC048349]|uniref:hypothetical protein n=1 Tax=Streptomyces sp. NPDC048349 TaxID=3155486 RepID=UPI00344A16A7